MTPPGRCEFFYLRDLVSFPANSHNLLFFRVLQWKLSFTSTFYLGCWSSYFWKINHLIPIGRKWPFHYAHSFCVLAVPKAPLGWFIFALKMSGKVQVWDDFTTWADNKCAVFATMSANWGWLSAGTLTRSSTGVSTVCPSKWSLHMD